MATIDNLSIQVTANADSAASALDRLASSAGGLRGAATRAGGGLRDLSAGAKDAGSATQEAGQQAGNAEKHTRNFGRASEEAGKAAKRGTAGISSFWQALKRIAYYRFIRTIIKGITDAFREGATNLYKWSQATGKSDFAKNLDRIATSINYLKNSIGAMLEPIVRILTPVIEWAIDGIVTIINWINKLFAALSGSETYTVAKKVAKSWDDATESVQGTQDAIKRTILGFDEINALNGNNKGGSGGGGSGQDYTELFETRPLDGWMKDLSEFIASIKEKFEPVKKFFDDIGDKARNIWDKFFNGGKEFLNDPLGWCDQHIGQPIIKGVKQIFGINSPSTEMETVGYYITLGLKQGMIDGLGDINQWLADNIVGPIIQAFEDIGSQALYFDIATNQNANGLWKGLETSWAALGYKKLYFDIGMNQNANGLWKGLETSWEALGLKKLFFNVAMNQNANGLWKGLETSWEALGNKKLYFNVAMNQNANGLWKGLETAWEALGLKKLFFNIATNQNANGLWEGLKTAWEALGAKKLYFDVGMNQNANGLWKGLETAWEALGLKKLFFDVAMNQNANGLWKGLETSWEALGNKKLYFNVAMNQNANGLWEGLKTAWEALGDKTLKVNVELDYSGTDGFGGATGGGGSTSGGGAGRGISIPIAEPTQEEVQSYWDSLLGYWNRIYQSGKSGFKLLISGFDSNSVNGYWASLKQTWDAGVVAAQKGLNVIIKPIQSSGQALSTVFTNIGQWLFGRSDTPYTSVGVVGNLCAGDGFARVNNDGTLTLTGVNPTETLVNGKPGKGFKSTLSGTNNYTLKGIDDVTATVNLESGWGDSLQKWFNTSFTGGKPSVNIIGNLTSEKTNWIKKGVQKWFNKENGSESKNPGVDLKGNLQKGNNMKQDTVYNWLGAAGGTLKVIIDFIGATWNAFVGLLKAALGMKANGGVFQNGVWSDIPQYAGGTTSTHGSLFLAGEAGPEIVGHVGGRTEVLNRSQLASTMYAAVRSAMSGVRIDASMYGDFSDDEGSSEEFAEFMRQDADAMRQQNELLRQQNELLRQLNEKEFEFSTTAVNRANAYMNRRAGMQIAPVGAQ